MNNISVANYSPYDYRPQQTDNKSLASILIASKLANKQYTHYGEYVQESKAHGLVYHSEQFFNLWLDIKSTTIINKL